MDGIETNELLWHRRHAMQIAMQLPEDKADALLILSATQRLVRDYLGEDLPDARLAFDATVLTFPVGRASAADANL